MRVPILMYHWFEGTGVGPTRGATFAINPTEFRRQMAWLAASGMSPVSVSQVLAALRDQASLPPRPYAVTFDDGYEDFYEQALPVLRQHRIPATLYMVSGLVGKWNVWDERSGEPRRPLMGWARLRELVAAGIDIGSHSLSHPDLRTLGDDELRHECEASRKQLEDGLGRKVTSFAYPFGFFDQRVKDAVRAAGYDGACAVLLRFRDMLRSDRFALMRPIVHASKSFANFRWRVRCAAPNHREN